MSAEGRQSESIDARLLTEDEIKKLILAASTDYERYTARVISRQRKEITNLESQLEQAKAALAGIIDNNGADYAAWQAAKAALEALRTPAQSP